MPFYTCPLHWLLKPSLSVCYSLLTRCMGHELSKCNLSHLMTLLWQEIYGTQTKGRYELFHFLSQTLATHTSASQHPGTLVDRYVRLSTGGDNSGSRQQRWTVAQKDSELGHTTHYDTTLWISSLNKCSEKLLLLKVGWCFSFEGDKSLIKRLQVVPIWKSKNLS